MIGKYKICIVVTWFGKLPAYFPVWLKSAEANTDVDFLVFSDQEIVTKANNIISYVTTLQETIDRFKEKLNRNISITNSYKFCDCRPFFGIAYQDYLKEYDFWGYCDIDLVFGKISDFITDDLLSKYDRFYQYGHLSLFRNSDKINHLYDLKGGIYSYREIFEKRAKTTPEEHYGINRICDKNNIKWYTHVDFADFAIKYPERLEVKHGLSNYNEQVFIWQGGHAFRVYKESGKIKEEEFIYMHWQKRKPEIIGEINGDSCFILTGNKIIVSPMLGNYDNLDFIKLNPPLEEKKRKKYIFEYKKKKMNEFIHSNIEVKMIWLRQKTWGLLTKRSYQ